MARIGLLTGGGDCPGLNAVIRAVVRKGINAYGHEFVGFRYGWAGVLSGDAIPLTHESTRGILHRANRAVRLRPAPKRREEWRVEGRCKLRHGYGL